VIVDASTIFPYWPINYTLFLESNRSLFLAWCDSQSRMFPASLEVGETVNDGAHERPLLFGRRDVSHRLLFHYAPATADLLRRRFLHPPLGDELSVPRFC
jgi:hypothetical protein